MGGEFKVVAQSLWPLSVKRYRNLNQKSAALPFRPGDEQHEKPRLISHFLMEIPPLAEPILVPNLWNRKSFSPSGRFLVSLFPV